MYYVKRDWLSKILNDFTLKFNKHEYLVSTCWLDTSLSHFGYAESGSGAIAHYFVVTMPKRAPPEATAALRLREQKEAFEKEMAAPGANVEPVGGMKLSISGTS